MQPASGASPGVPQVSRRRLSSRGGGDDSASDSFPLPPALARIPAGRDRLPREFVEQSQRDRILLAALDVFGEKGFAAATVQDLVSAASISRETFYKYFAGKEACLRALHEEVLSWLEDEAHEAAARADGWADSVIAVCERLLALLVADPRVARLCAIESLFGGPEIMDRWEAAVARLAAALRVGRAEHGRGSRLPASLEPLLLAGAISLVGRGIAFGREPVPDAAELSELILIFYLEEGEARRIVRGRT
jgi:AcrR family transcriptional regulator